MLKSVLPVFLLLISATAYASEHKLQDEQANEQKELTIQLEELNRKYELAVQGMKSGSTGVGLAAVVALVLVVSAAWTYHKHKQAWIGGPSVAFIFFAMIGGLVAYFSFIFDREADLRAEISNTTSKIGIIASKCE